MAKLSVLLLSILVAGLMVGTISGCKKEAGWKSRTFVERNLAANSGESQVPSVLWERLITPDKPLKSLIEISQAPTPNQGGGDSAVARSTVETDLKGVTVYFIEETHGVLGGRNLKLVFGPGGGDIDLRDFVIENRGAFRVVFEFAPDAEPEAVKRVWYLSNAQTRKVGPDKVGAGCDTYMDISSFVKKEGEKDGILIAVGGDRHVSALAGTYLFAVKRAGRVEVSRLTVLDSSKRKLQCRG